MVDVEDLIVVAQRRESLDVIELLGYFHESIVEQLCSIYSMSFNVELNFMEVVGI